MTEFIQYEDEDWGKTNKLVRLRAISAVYCKVRDKTKDKDWGRAKPRIWDRIFNRVWDRVRGRVYEETER